MVDQNAHNRDRRELIFQYARLAVQKRSVLSSDQLDEISSDMKKIRTKLEMLHNAILEEAECMSLEQKGCC